MPYNFGIEKKAGIPFLITLAWVQRPDDPVRLEKIYPENTTEHPIATLWLESFQNSNGSSDMLFIFLRAVRAELQ